MGGAKRLTPRNNLGEALNSGVDAFIGGDSFGAQGLIARKIADIRSGLRLSLGDSASLIPELRDKQLLAERERMTATDPSLP